MTVVLQPRRGVSTSRRCANCRHRWWVARWQCGKEGVTQTRVEDARAPEGDCGPEGKFFLEDQEE